MIDNKFSLPVPYIVSAVFSDGTKHQQLIKTMGAHSPAAAAGMAVSEFYMQGGKLPLLLIHVMQVEEATARAAVAAFEEIAAANKAETEKVSSLRVVHAATPAMPTLSQPSLPNGPKYHPFESHPFVPLACRICGGDASAMTHNAAAMTDQPPAGD